MMVQINPRRAAVREMRQALSWLRSMITLWADPPSCVWYDAGDGRGSTYQIGRDGAGRRARADIPASEYQENSPERLRQLITYMQAVKIKADEVIEIAEGRLFEVERR